MKKLIYGTLFLASVGIGITSCEKKELNNSINSNDVKIENKSHIPTFKSMEEVNETLDFLSNMGEDERRTYEQQNNSKSLLTTVYEAYEGVDMENLVSREELENHIAKHPSMLSLNTTSDRELEYHPYFSDNHYSAIADKDRLFIIKELCFKVFDDGLVSTHKSNIELLKAISAVSIKDVRQTDEITISELKYEQSTYRAACSSHNVARETNGKERTKMFVAVTLFRMDNGGGNFTDVVDLYGRIRPYKKTLGVWYHARRTISGKFLATARFNNPGTQTFTLNSNVSPQSAYSVYRNQGGLSINVPASNPRIVNVNSWGDTPSTSTVSIICN